MDGGIQRADHKYLVVGAGAGEEYPQDIFLQVQPMGEGLLIVCSATISGGHVALSRVRNISLTSRLRSRSY